MLGCTYSQRNSPHRRSTVFLPMPYGASQILWVHADARVKFPLPGWLKQGPTLTPNTEVQSSARLLTMLQ